MHTLSRETVSQNIPLLKLKVLQYLLLLYFLGICKMKNEIETKRNGLNLPKRIFGYCSLDAKVGNFLNQITHFPGSKLFFLKPGGGGQTNRTKLPSKENFKFYSSLKCKFQKI